MKKNIGNLDKAFRLLIVLGVVVLALGEHIDGVLAMALGLLAIIMAVTSMLGFCPLYQMMGINTSRAGACCCSCSCSEEKKTELEDTQKESCCDDGSDKKCC